jgi:hypothetical protein
LLDLADTLTNLVQSDDSLLLLLFLLFLRLWRLMGTYYCTTIDATDDVKDVVVVFKLLKREGAFNKAAFAIAKLSELIIAPVKESSVFKRHKIMPLATAQVVDVQRFLLLV